MEASLKSPPSNPTLISRGLELSMAMCGAKEAEKQQGKVGSGPVIKVDGVWVSGGLVAICAGNMPLAPSSKS